MFQDVKQLAILLLRKNADAPNLDELIVQEAERAIEILNANPAIKDEIIYELRKCFNVTVSFTSVLKNEDDSEHVAWLDVEKVNRGKQWARHRTYLESVKNWPVKVVDSINNTTNTILGLLENPSVKGKTFDRRGLVMGYVQSGKTANYTALINKAFDSGYKVIIVLAGMHNNLRSQTQARLDEEVLGVDTIGKEWIGVSLHLGQRFNDIAFLTSRHDDGDFNAKKVRVGLNPHKQPLLLVVKKNVSVLKNLLQYFRHDSPFAKYASSDALYKTVPDLPLLIIDDEADQATVNTAEIYDENDKLLDDYDPSKINGLIREIYHTFEQRAYVGYTATPFANIFIDQDAQTKQHGEDLFPKDFIVCLPKPSNYVGPSEFFDYEDSEDNDAKLIREVKQDKGFLPSNHKKSHSVHSLPDTLIESIHAFVLSTALRNLRGQVRKHNSMLIHVTRFKEVQGQVCRLVQEYVEDMKLDLEDKINGTVYLDLKNLYKDFVKTSHAHEAGGDVFDWQTVQNVILPVVKSIQVKAINGDSDDVLAYSDNKDEGLTVIAVGGDKLSRGLTLEGLTVSYYLRTSKMYDTLMQMGRWFGYRDGYLDLCRIYTTRELADWFRYIARATEELIGQLEYMADIGATPKEYLLKVNDHPDMSITNAMKMRSTKKVRVSYSAELIQTTVFQEDKEFLAGNIQAATHLLKRLQKEYPLNPSTNRVIGDKNHYYWLDVDGYLIVDFLSEYKTSPGAPRANSDALRDYISKRIQEDELIRWTVVLYSSNSKETEYIELNDLNIRTVKRGKKSSEHSKQGVRSIRILTSPGNEHFDYTHVQKAKADEMIENRIKKERASSIAAYKKARTLRSPQEGILLLYAIDRQMDQNGALFEETPVGIAISFPQSQSKNAYGEFDYVVNKSIEQDWYNAGEH